MANLKAGCFGLMLAGRPRRTSSSKMDLGILTD
jgi:hypothetical protein